MDNAGRSAHQLRENAIRSSGNAVDSFSSFATDTRARIRPAREYAEDVVRDNGVYLGIAALAVGAAAGIGIMQMNKPRAGGDADIENEDVRLE
jgi:ElaB/YqjD/DUF883 family membrane-anchored ribosome-binding protein